MPVIRPYIVPPAHVEVALLTDLGHVIDEHGQRRQHNEPHLLVFSSVEAVNKLVSAGCGEALTWDGIPKRWRSEPVEEDQWRNRASDVAVLALPSWPDETELTLKGLAAWRDWLESSGAHPTHAMGGSALSLLRATIDRPVWTMRGEAPPFTWVMGPRIYLPEYVDPMTSYYHAVHVDLSAAYPRAMSTLPYGDAIWRHRSRSELLRWPLAERNKLTPLVVRAKVLLPHGLLHGLLPDRPAELPEVAKGDWNRCELLDGAAVARFPRSGTVEGVWSWDELSLLYELGAGIDVEEGWILQHDGTLPFWRWWLAVEQGRELPRFAGLLAKACSNACWGALVPSRGTRQLVRPGQRSVRLPELPRRPSSFDLAELVTARVRAQGAQMMQTVSSSLLSYHTDGGWLLKPVPKLPEPWRPKGEADRLDIIDPQAWRYWPKGKADPLYTIAGVPHDAQESWWGEVWSGRQ